MQNKGYPSEWLEQLKSKSDIISVISKYVTLQRKGRKYWGCCPFHHEKTPSFCVNDEEGYFHCFGCKESGDVITFIQKYENVEFTDAIKMLAEQAGMEIPEFSGEEDVKKRKQDKEISLKILELTNTFFRSALLKKESKVAQDYIRGRGLKGSDLEKFQIGYSPNWNDLVKYLTSQKFNTAQMKMAGVSEINEKGNAYDVMAGRLTFPIFNQFGEVIGFSARALESNAYAKYKNTAQTIVFDKSKAIYGIQFLRTLRQKGELKEVIIVEGQMDVIAMHKAGFTNTIACMGTAFTQEHAKTLHKYSDNIVLCLDGDEAGKKASLRNVDILMQEGVDTKVVLLKEAKDPDEYLIKFGADKLKLLINEGHSALDFKIMCSAENLDMNKNSDRAKFINQAFSILSVLKTASEKQGYLELIKSISGVPIDTLRRDVDKIKDVHDKFEVSASQDEERESVVSKAEKFILASILYKKGYSSFDYALDKYLTTGTYIKLYNFLKESTKGNGTIKVSTIYDNFDVDNDKNLQDIITFNLEIEGDPKRYFEDSIWLVYENYLKKQQELLKDKYNTSALISDRKRILLDINDLAKKLRNKNIEEIKN